jgi:hypothetical protein
LKENYEHQQLKKKLFVEEIISKALKLRILDKTKIIPEKHRRKIEMNYRCNEDEQIPA